MYQKREIVETHCRASYVGAENFQPVWIKKKNKPLGRVFSMPVLRSDVRRRRYSLDFLFLLHQGKRKRKINSLDFYSLSKGFSRFQSSYHPFGMLNELQVAFSIIMPSFRDVEYVSRCVFYNHAIPSGLLCWCESQFAKMVKPRDSRVSFIRTRFNDIKDKKHP
jgi:hypothetical protein